MDMKHLVQITSANPLCSNLLAFIFLFGMKPLQGMKRDGERGLGRIRVCIDSPIIGLHEGSFYRSKDSPNPYRTRSINLNLTLILSMLI